MRRVRKRVSLVLQQAFLLEGVHQAVEKVDDAVGVGEAHPGQTAAVVVAAQQLHTAGGCLHGPYHGEVEHKEDERGERAGGRTPDDGCADGAQEGA